MRAPRCLLFCLLAAAWIACGPSLAEVRRRVSLSPRHVVALFPIDSRSGPRGAAGQATDLLDAKLRRDGFSVIDRGKTLKVFNASLLRNGAYDAPADAAELGRALGANAVLVGAVTDAYERALSRPAQYDFIPVPPPGCCANSKNPCHRQVYDPLLRYNVDICAGTHRRYLVQAALNQREAGVSLGLRLIDAKTQAVLWQASYAARVSQGPLRLAADQATEILESQLTDAFLNGKL